MSDRPEEAQANGTGLQVAMDSYLSALMALAKMMGEVCPQVGGPYEDRMLRLRRRLAFDATPENMEETREALESDLKDFSGKASSYYRNIWGEAHEMLAVAKENAETLSGRHAFYTSRLRQFAQDMEAAVLRDDPEELQAAFALQAAGLRECVDSMHKEVEGLLARFTARVVGLERGFSYMHAGEDPRAEFLDRSDVERLLGDGPVQGVALVVFELQGLAQARRQHGHAAAEGISREFGQRLLDRIRATDRVAQWDDTRFLAVIRGTIKDAVARTSKIHFWLEGRYPIASPYGATYAEINVAVRYLDPLPGEARSAFLARVDQPEPQPAADAGAA